jgi:ABC-2 type transport system ATP-binding protein
VDPVLQYDHVEKNYRSWRGRRVRALNDFSLSIERGEIFGFLGPNGAGKTTAIHLAMGFMRPSHGHGTMLGHPFGDARTRRRVGFLAENVALYHRPALRLVAFYGALNGMHDSRLRRRCHEVIQQVGLEADAHRNAGKFSRGMLQRLGLAQALVNDPDLLVLDEPTSALDPLARVSVRELLIDARDSGKTVFLSSHLLSEVESVCDRVAFVRAGHVICVGRTADLLESREQVEIIVRNAGESWPGAEVVPEGTKLVAPRTQMREVVEQLWQQGGEIVRVNPVRRSLEEVFVELTGRPEQDERSHGAPGRRLKNTNADDVMSATKDDE